MDKTRNVINISTKINPKTNAEFGEKFAGDFVLSKLTMRSMNSIDGKILGFVAQNGLVTRAQLETDAKAFVRVMVYAYVDVLGMEVPEWWHSLNPLSKTDTEAMYAVWEGMSEYLSTFRQD